MSRAYWRFGDFLLAAMLLAAFSLHIISFYVQPSICSFDFSIFYHAGHTALSNAQDIYNVEIERQKLTGTLGLPYLYPPQSLLFFKSLAILPLMSACHLWLVMNMVCSLLLLWLFSYIGLCKTTGSITAAACMLILWRPWYNAIIFGQPMLWVTVSFLGSYLLAQRSHYYSAALILTAFAFKPPMSIALVIYLLILHGKPMAKALLFAAVLFIVACGIAYGWQVWWLYFKIIISSAQFMHDQDFQMATIKALAFLLFTERHYDSINALCGMIWIISFIIIGWIGFIVRRGSSMIQDIGLAMIIVISAVCNPYLFVESITPQAIAVAYLCKYMSHKLYGAIYIYMSIVASVMQAMVPEPILWVGMQILLIGSLTNLFLGVRQHERI
jgi:hypothetical protein